MHWPPPVRTGESMTVAPQDSLALLTKTGGRSDHATTRNPEASNTGAGKMEAIADMCSNRLVARERMEVGTEARPLQDRQDLDRHLGIFKNGRNEETMVRLETTRGTSDSSGNLFGGARCGR